MTRLVLGVGVALSLSVGLSAQLGLGNAYGLAAMSEGVRRRALDDLAQRLQLQELQINECYMQLREAESRQQLAAAQALAACPKPAPVAEATETCFFEREAEAGLNKICYYSCPSGEAAITLRSTALCPLSLHR